MLQFVFVLINSRKIMKILAIAAIFLSEFTSAFYQESSQEMLSQCSIHQHKVNQEDRVKHLCEKPNFDDEFSYFITPMETKSSKRKFLCFLFFKSDQQKLKFKLWFSHKNYTVNAVSHSRSTVWI